VAELSKLTESRRGVGRCQEYTVGGKRLCSHRGSVDCRTKNGGGAEMDERSLGRERGHSFLGMEKGFREPWLKKTPEKKDHRS